MGGSHTSASEAKEKRRVGLVGCGCGWPSGLAGPLLKHKLGRRV
jgi:hypothetical protein